MSYSFVRDCPYRKMFCSAEHFLKMSLMNFNDTINLSDVLNLSGDIICSDYKITLG